MLASLAASGSRWLDPPDPRVASMMEARIDGVRRAHLAGVAIATGTDAGANGTFHGMAVHRELELLVQAGLTPLEAITAGTRNPPRKLSVEPTVGTLVDGMRADIVVLDDDPLVDIANTRTISAVVHGGVLT
jgi:imidazolonepropionase-like amidohydrolase